jgi:hypothetical protein
VTAGVLASAGFVLIIASTQGDPGVTVDSGSYLAVADGIRTGHGPTSPVMHYGEPYPAHIDIGERTVVTHFPPLYPAVIAAFGGVTGLDSLQAARWLGALTMAITVAWVTILVGRRTQSIGLALLGGGMAMATDLVRVNSMVWSEGIFGLAVIATIVQAERYLRCPTAARRWSLIALAATGPLIRFMGLALPVGVALIVVVLGAGSLRRRCRDAVLVAGLALVPIGAWTAVAGIGRGSGSLRWHPPPAEAVLAGFRAIGQWAGLGDGGAQVAGVLVIAAAAGVGLTWSRQVHRSSTGADPAGRFATPDDMRTLGAAGLLIAGTMVVLLVLARLLVDALIPFGSRMLAPLHLVAAIVVPLAVSRLPRPSRHLAVALGLTVVVAGLVGAGRDAARFSESNSSYTGRRWERSPTMAAVRSFPRGTVVATNAPDAVWLHTGRAPLMLPLRTDLYGGGPNRQLPEQAEVLAEALRGEQAIVVFFDRPTQGGQRSLDPRLTSALGLEVDDRYEDGTTYRVAGE